MIDTNIDPLRPPGAPATAIQAIEATTVNAPGLGGTIFNITDGLQFTFRDNLNQVATFEFNAGPELNFIYTPQTGAFVRDGQTFELDLDSTDANPPITFEFNTGQVQPLLDRLGVDFTPDTPVAELSLAQMQLLEIAKALSLDARLVIMDEPTSSLTIAETKRLMRVIADLKANGVSVIFISHRLN